MAKDLLDNSICGQSVVLLNESVDEDLEMRRMFNDISTIQSVAEPVSQKQKVLLNCANCHTGERVKGGRVIQCSDCRGSGKLDINAMIKKEVKKAALHISQSLSNSASNQRECKQKDLLQSQMAEAKNEEMRLSLQKQTIDAYKEEVLQKMRFYEQEMVRIKSLSEENLRLSQKLDVVKKQISQ